MRAAPPSLSSTSNSTRLLGLWLRSKRWNCRLCRLCQDWERQDPRFPHGQTAACPPARRSATLQSGVAPRLQMQETTNPRFPHGQTPSRQAAGGVAIITDQPRAKRSLSWTVVGQISDECHRALFLVGRSEMSPLGFSWGRLVTCVQGGLPTQALQAARRCVGKPVTTAAGLGGKALARAGTAWRGISW